MTRHKRRKITGIVRICLLVAVPVLTAVTAVHIPDIKKLGDIRIEGGTEDTGVMSETVTTADRKSVV